VSVRIKVRDRKKPLVKTTGFTIYDDREVTLKRGMEIIEAERLNVHGYSRKRKSMQTLAEYFAAYKREYLKVERTPEEIQHYIVRLEHFFTRSAVCDLGLDELTKKHCEDYIVLRRKTKHSRGALYAEGTIRVECEGIKALIEDAVEAGKIARNPWKGVELPRQSLRERVLERWELDAIIERLSPEARRAAYLVINSGLRRREYAFIRSCDIRNNTIFVSKETAKGHKARPVPITDIIVGVINLQRQDRGLTARSEERLWPYNPGWLSRKIKLAVRAAGIERATPHDFRRTWATELCESMPLKALMHLLGHASPVVTTRVYTIAKKRKIAAQIIGGATLFAPDATKDATVGAKSA
jgi:integrase